MTDCPVWRVLGTRKTLCVCVYVCAHACVHMQGGVLKRKAIHKCVEAETGRFHVGSADSGVQRTASGAPKFPRFCSSLLMG